MKPKSIVSISKKSIYEKQKASINKQLKPLLNNDCSKPFPSMNQQEITPPAYMWDRISSALDEQDRNKPIKGNQLIMPFTKISRDKLAIFATVAILAGAIKTLFFRNPAF